MALEGTARNLATLTQIMSHSATILIVEDEVFVALDVERALIDAGYSVAGIAMDLSEALSMGEGCNLALVDINLRDGRTGPQIAADLYAKYAVRSVFVTANPAQIGVPPTGALGYVCKPFNPAMLHAAVQWALADGHSRPDNDAVVPLMRVSDH